MALMALPRVRAEIRSARRSLRAEELPLMAVCHEYRRCAAKRGLIIHRDRHPASPIQNCVKMIVKLLFHSAFSGNGIFTEDAKVTSNVKRKFCSLCHKQNGGLI